MNHTKGMQALKLMFQRATSVTCSNCARDLTHETNLARLARLGCPGCGCTKWMFDLPEGTELPEGITTNDVPSYFEDPRWIALGEEILQVEEDYRQAEWWDHISLHDLRERKAKLQAERRAIELVYLANEEQTLNQAHGTASR